MKLQNMTVIFIIIMIPIIIVTSYYIGLQIKTITMQKDYTVKLQTAAKDSIQALEINTVEWNSSSSNLADSKRRDVLAAINTFTTSLANSMGIGGAGKERIQTYIPAIAYTMYDGYYIYSASKVDTQDTDENGLTQFNSDGTINTKGESYQYILKPYSPYSARYVNSFTDITVNYTLDNYIKIYGTVKEDYVTKEGYLVVCDDDAGVKSVSENSISGIKYRGATITPEYLTEQIYIEGEGVKEYTYIYDQYDNKQYWDSDANNYFTVNADNQKVYLQKAVEEGDANFSISNTFRKISVPQGSGTDWSVLKIFQILNPYGGYKFYYEDTRGAYIELPSSMAITGMPTDNDLNDYSAINYCVESYVFTKWVTNNLNDIEVSNLKSPNGGQYNNVESNKKIFEISNTNNPDPENDEAYATSVLAQHKKDVIINTLEKNLAQAQAQAQEMNPNYEYRLPQLTYDEWEQALSNISIIAYMQGMPIGLKYYNNYTIATSTLNKEYVDPDELYFAGTNDQYYHQRNCNQATGSDYVGYRSIDYVAKSYEKDGTTNYYYPHDKSEESSNTDAELECYYCLVNRSTYGTVEKSEWTDSYYNALARERYKQIDEPGTYRPDVSITKTASASTVEYGDYIQYTIKIINNGLLEDEVVLKDDLANGKLEFVNFIGDEEKYIEKRKDSSGKDYLISKDNVSIKINAGESKEFKYLAKPTGELGKDIENTAYVYSYVTSSIEYGHATAKTKTKKTITIASKGVSSSEKYNVIMVLDNSWSLTTNLLEIKSAAQKLDTALKSKGDVTIKYVKFSGSATKMNSLNDYFVSISGGTNYKDALEKANELVDKSEEEEVKNIVVFMSDGCPTSNIIPTFDGWFGTIWNNTIANILNTVSGGWLELVWSGENAYGFRLLVTLGNTLHDLVYDWAESMSVSYQVWNSIMEEVNDIKEYVDQFYTVYFRSTLGDDGPVYGLRQMATEDNNTYFKDAKNIGELEKNFEEIVQNTFPETPDLYEYKDCDNNIIKIKNGISEIKVDGVETAFSEKIFNDDEENCELDISDWLDKEITIIY